jgi:S1-C subfamily serine protease
MGFAKTVDQAKPVLGAPLKGSITIGRYTLERPALRFVDMAKGVGNVGAAVLQQFVITIDPANMRLRLGGPRDGTLKESDEQKPRYGVQLSALDASPIQVRVVDAGSPAEKAGLRPGDRITRMNGRAVEGLGVNERVDALRESPLTVTIQRDKHTLEISMAFP